MSTTGLPWLAACAALAALWVLAASWNRERGSGATALRGVLGGLAALVTAWGAYALVHAVGVDLRWDWLSGASWPALGAAAGIGLIEEGAKLTGIALAVSPGRRDAPPRRGAARPRGLEHRAAGLGPGGLRGRAARPRALALRARPRRGARADQMGGRLRGP